MDESEIVALVPDKGAQRRLQAFAQAKGYSLREVTRLGSLGLIMVSFDMPEGTTGKQAIAELEAAVSTATVGVNHAYREEKPGRVSAALSYANSLLDWPQSGCRALAPIGMIDTYVDGSAARLSGKRLIQQRFTSGPVGAGRHGTEVASVLADPTRLSSATLYSAAVVEDTKNAGRAAGADTLIKALDWLSAQGVKVVNISMAGPFNKLLDLAVKRAADRGLIMVAAVGNAGPDVGPQYPAAFDAVIAVTAVDADGKIYRNAVRGPHVDIAAPGVDVLASSGQGRQFVTGTSFAAPFVTARIAADAAMLANPSAAKIRQRLVETSQDLGKAGPDNIFGNGLLQATGLCMR